MVPSLVTFLAFIPWQCMLLTISEWNSCAYISLGWNRINKVVSNKVYGYAQKWFALLTPIKLHEQRHFSCVGTMVESDNNDSVLYHTMPQFVHFCLQISILLLVNWQNIVHFYVTLLLKRLDVTYRAVPEFVITYTLYYYLGITTYCLSYSSTVGPFQNIIFHYVSRNICLISCVVIFKSSCAHHTSQINITDTNVTFSFNKKIYPRLSDCVDFSTIHFCLVHAWCMSIW